MRASKAMAMFVGVFAGVALLSAQITPVHQVVVDVDPVAVDVAVTDEKGRAVAGLSREDFAVYEDGEPQTIRDVQPVGMPYSILILVDRSPREDKSNWPEFVIDSVELFLRNMRGPDRLAVAAFDDRVAVLVDWRPSRTGNVQKIMLRKSDQPTRFFEAVNWAEEEMQYIATSGTSAQPLANGRKGVIVFTDGRDEAMYPTYQKVDGQTVPDPAYEVSTVVEERFEKSRSILQAGKVPFYFVAMDTDIQLSRNSSLNKLEGWMRFLTEVRGRMEQLARVSGGDIIFPKRIEELLPLYELIHRNLGTGYHVTYDSQRPPDGRLRQIEVVVRNMNLAVSQSHNKYYPR